MAQGEQYSTTGIFRYEWIFGPGFLGYGEPQATRNLYQQLELPSQARVLDVGSGLGGPDFLLADEFGARVTGVDLTPEIVDIAKERLQKKGLENVEFFQGDIQAMDWPPGSFDLVWSRETLLHVPDKDKLFRKFHRWLEPGGGLIITDYARRKGRGSDTFEQYIKDSGYPLLELEEYGSIISEAGFDDLRIEDRTEDLIAIMEEQLQKLSASKQEFCERFSEEDYDYIKGRWELKLNCCREGDMKWGWFLARRPA